MALPGQDSPPTPAAIEFAPTGNSLKLAYVVIACLAIAISALSASPATVAHWLRSPNPATQLIGADDPGNDPGAILCRDVTPVDRTLLERGFTTMRGIGDGERLFQVLIAHDVCITVRDLTLYAGLALPRTDSSGNWSRSTIEIDRAYLSSANPDILATTLVHEATHIERSITGATCLNFDGCRLLTDAAILEEEIAAHQAEAQWWLAAYGPTGKPTPGPFAVWENRLATTYLSGPAVFAEFVASFRTDTTNEQPSAVSRQPSAERRPSSTSEM